MTGQIIKAGGVVPYYFEPDGTIKMMFMIPSDPKFGGTKPQIAKGKIEKGEEVEVGSFREAREELGLFIGNVIQKHSVGTFLVGIQVYCAEIKDLDFFGIPDFETKETKWLTMEQFISQGYEAHVPAVKACYRIIQRNGTAKQNE